MEKSKTAIAYLRVSTEEQARQGISLGVQEQDIRHYCDQNKILLLRIFRDEGVSAGKAIAARPALAAMLECLPELRPGLLLLWRLDRLFRRVGDYYTVMEHLRTAETQWFCVNEPDYDTRTATGRLYINIKLAIAENERDQTGERLTAMFRSRMERGILGGGSRTFGYDIRCGADGRKLVPNSKEAALVREIFAQYLKVESIAEVSRWLSREHGVEKSPKALRRSILGNTTYIGVRRVLRHGSTGSRAQDVLYCTKNFCEPILSEKIFVQAQNLLAQNLR